MVTYALREENWESFKLEEEDIEFLYNHLLELETPLTPIDLISALVQERIQREIREIEKQRTSGGDIYFPKEHYAVDQSLIFPAFDWQQGKVVAVRPGRNPDLPDFDVIKVQMSDGNEHEFAAGIQDHVLNEPPEIVQGDSSLDLQYVLNKFGDELEARLEQGLFDHPDFVRIAGRWFPRALLVDVNVGHLNLAEAVLDMEGGGPLSTPELLKHVELPSDVNTKLVEFSLDLALEEDERFDEVGPAGQVLWYLKRLEPKEVLEVPTYLRYHQVDYDRSELNKEMLIVERDLDDELSPIEARPVEEDEVVIRLIFPHWRAGTVPLSTRIQHLFPTAYEAPRIRFVMVDGKTKQKFPGWVVRNNHYVYGLKEWYADQGLIPGSFVRLRRGNKPGEVIVSSEIQRSSRDWMRTLLVGSDGGIVFAMLKQIVSAAYDERMAIAIPDVEALDVVWKNVQKSRRPFERIMVDMVRELAKLNPQSHVHASELYAAVNLVNRCPPGPILGLLASRPWFVHVGDMYFRFDDSQHA
jgi:hypothetical protein